MKTDFKTATIGISGFLGTITIDQINHYIAFCVGALTILGLIPLVVIRWKKFFSKDTIPPFES